MTDRPFYILDGEPVGKASILREGLRLFATKGLSETTIRDIGAAAGLTNPALYKHFRTKHDLALTLFERCYREHMKRLVQATPKELRFSEKFQGFVRCVLGAYDVDPNAAIFVTDNLTILWPEASERLSDRTAISILREILEDGRKAGLVGQDETVELQISMVIGLLNQLMRQIFLCALPGPARSYAEGSARLLHDGLG
ncbi:TetR/AcrR family transcriptional regulator [Aliiroseovarius sp. F47248L]|uniref:TetR/AcrR family transcriptional regulator n=1 Tax=Aliiroseovarius sp. F47248L TaxID=2926420 RepID=UPI001FF377C3|nr:TetR/AcrR family transcriptional regulator [Aliiroseovarius sp. F47248L]MCK0138588.1 TetR/AcrR family transcriptional regulator [Aliiroseovarius sp. F47248L]